MPKVQDVMGHRFGKLVVIGYERPGYRVCRCDCGKITSPTLGHLRKGISKSCGCASGFSANYIAAVTKHGMYETRTYKTWQAMKSRCLSETCKDYPRYGAKGVTVCPEWASSFERFLSDMGERPEGMTLDRFPDKHGNYEPSNCRWATPAQQSRNQCTTRLDPVLVCMMRYLSRRGHAKRDIAKHFGVIEGTASDAILGKTWKDPFVGVKRTIR